MKDESSSPGFTHSIRVSPADIDELGHVNNVVYIRWVQEVAAAHWQAIAGQPLKDKLLWVVLRHEIDYRRPCYLNDVVIGKTWVGEHHGAKFERFVDLKSEKSGEVLAQAKTIWCLLDAATRKPVRIPKEVLEVL